MELFNKNKYDFLPDKDFKQTNYSLSHKNVFRGIHVAPFAKLITCLSGSILDIILDPKDNSCISVELSSINHKQVYIPANCGHGFLSKEENTIVVYTQTGLYDPKIEKTIRYDQVDIDLGTDLIISEKDLK